MHKSINGSFSLGYSIHKYCLTLIIIYYRKIAVFFAQNHCVDHFILLINKGIRKRSVDTVFVCPINEHYICQFSYRNNANHNLCYMLCQLNKLIIEVIFNICPTGKVTIKVQFSQGEKE